jgi:hypothetical protein
LSFVGEYGWQLYRNLWTDWLGQCGSLTSSSQNPNRPPRPVMEKAFTCVCVCMYIYIYIYQSYEMLTIRLPIHLFYPSDSWLLHKLHVWSSVDKQNNRHICTWLVPYPMVSACAGFTECK